MNYDRIVTYFLTHPHILNSGQAVENCVISTIIGSGNNG